MWNARVCGECELSVSIVLLAVAVVVSYRELMN